MDDSALNQSLLDFLRVSPSPFHAVSGLKEALVDVGYVVLNESDAWALEPGKYLVTRNDSSLIAFTWPGDAGQGIRMVGAHTDSPCLKVKPNPSLQRQGYYQLGVEVYGGALLNPWFDRDLSIAGRVSFSDKQGVIHSRLIDFRQPIAMIPSLAIHLDREANNQRNVNAQTDIVPLLMRADADSLPDFRDLLKQQLLSEHEGLDIGNVLDYELYLYDTQPPALVGMQQEFIASARLDNLVSCYVGLQALIDTGSDSNGAAPSMLICTDHEEVGSASACGAQGPFLKSVLERLVDNNQQLSQVIDQSMMISADNAHGIHPNFADKHDGNHGPILNQGPVIKINANQRYATNSETAARFRQLCQQAEVPMQDFAMRSDMACGSTIGPITASEVGVKTVDVGIPQFAMHSIRETCGSKDPHYLYQVLKQFYAS